MIALMNLLYCFCRLLMELQTLRGGYALVNSFAYQVV